MTLKEIACIAKQGVCIAQGMNRLFSRTSEKEAFPETQGIRGAETE